jgi:glutamine phosphoribosylpyrophosphate amidotransferase
MVGQIAKNLGIDSLKFQDMNDMVEAIGLPKESCAPTAGIIQVISRARDPRHQD